MTDTFASNRIAELPATQRGREAQAWATGMGQVQDDSLPVARVAALADLPRLCADDALDYVGGWLLLPRYPGEVNGTPTDGYRGRLCAAWPTWLKAGTAQAVIDSLNGYGITDVQVFADYQGHFAPGAWFSRFWIVCGPNFGATGIAPLTMPFTLGPDALLGSSATAQQIRAIKQQILKFKAAHGYPVHIIFIFPDNCALGLSLTMPFTLGGSQPAVYKIGQLFGYDSLIGAWKIGGYTV